MFIVILFLLFTNNTAVLQGQPEFLGRCTATPQVKLEEESYNPAQLDWFDIYRGIVKAGQLLASFELLEVSSTSTHGEKPNRRNFPVWSDLGSVVT